VRGPAVHPRGHALRLPARPVTRQRHAWALPGQPPAVASRGLLGSLRHGTQDVQELRKSPSWWGTPRTSHDQRGPYRARSRITNRVWLSPTARSTNAQVKSIARIGDRRCRVECKTSTRSGSMVPPRASDRPVSGAESRGAPGTTASGWRSKSKREMPVGDLVAGAGRGWLWPVRRRQGRWVAGCRGHGWADMPSREDR
jgi:hypothetical protein